MTGRSRRNVLTGAVAVIAAAATFPHRLMATGTGKRKPRAHIVEIEKLRFSPAILKARPGDTITWINFDVVPHTASALDKSWDTGLIEKDASKTIKVTRTTSSAYYCKYHPSMKAKLEIT